MNFDNDDFGDDYDENNNGDSDDDNEDSWYLRRVEAIMANVKSYTLLAYSILFISRLF